MRNDMSTTIYRYLLAAAAIATLTLAACSDIGRSGVPETDNGPAELYVAVQLDNAQTETRADGDGNADDEDNGYDNWSYRGFSPGDKLGFFSPHGDYEKWQNGEDDAFVNVFLEYIPYGEEGMNYFHNPDIRFNARFIDDPGNCLVYMPYAGERDKAEFELRRSGGEKFDDKILRCVDYLQTQNNLQISASENSATLGGTMAHSFSELIIMRGPGFDKIHDDPEMNKITVVLTQGFSHMRIKVPTLEERAENDKWYSTPELFYEPGYSVDGKQMSEDACTRWEAWKGNKFLRTDKNNIGVEAWYVILPTLPSNYSTVSYIEMYDNEGQLQKVTAIKLQHHDENNRLLSVDKRLYPGWRYPVEIRMDELVPTINPYPISSWNSANDGKDTDITNERKRGIASPRDFVDWLTFYNAYINNPANEGDLLYYGDRIYYQGSDRVEWHFYLLSDIDLSECDLSKFGNGAGDPLIPELRDILDGRSTTRDGGEFENYTLKNLTTPLVGTMNANGQLLNMDFEEPDIQIQTEEPFPAGILVNTMAGGTVKNCNITGTATLFNPGGPVGIIAGEITGESSISDCTVTGILWGSESARDANYIYGKKDASVRVTLERNKTDVVYSDTDPTN